MATKTAKKTKSSSVRMREAGFSPVQLWLSVDDRVKIEEAAEKEKRPMTQFLIFHGLIAAEKIFRKNGQKAFT